MIVQLVANFFVIGVLIDKEHISLILKNNNGETILKSLSRLDLLWL
jgi:hypothetical protein